MSTQRILAELERLIADMPEHTYGLLDLREVKQDCLSDFRDLIIALPPDDLAAELAVAKVEIERLREALKKISMYRSNDPYFTMIIGIAGDIVEPMEVVLNAALDAKIGELK